MEEKERQAIETVTGMKVEELTPGQIEWAKKTFGYSAELLRIEWGEFKTILNEEVKRGLTRLKK